MTCQEGIREELNFLSLNQVIDVFELVKELRHSKNYYNALQALTTPIPAGVLRYLKADYKQSIRKCYKRLRRFKISKIYLTDFIDDLHQVLCEMIGNAAEEYGEI